MNANITAAATAAAAAAGRLDTIINGFRRDGVADVWVSPLDLSVHIAFYDATDSQLLMNALNASTPDRISPNANVVDARLTALHLSFADSRSADWFASVVDLADIDFPRY